MNESILNDVADYIEKHIDEFNDSRLAILGTLNLAKILKKKNPYLYTVTNMNTPTAIVQDIMDAFISSSLETRFGDWLEGLAIFVCNKVYGGYKSSARGIDLEFTKENIRYIVSIKSGSNWGNSGQIHNMTSNFNDAKKTLHTSSSRMNVVAVNGCCYGKGNKIMTKDNYMKLCGQDFWEFISGIDDLYIKIIEHLGKYSELHQQKYLNEYRKLLDKFTRQFSQEFCDTDGKVDWVRILTLNSQSSSSK